MREHPPAWMVILWVIMCVITSAGISHDITKQSTDDAWRDIIANKDCAEYYLDSKHQRQWRWK